MFFQRLRDLREDKDLRQEDVAEILGISQTVYSRYERGFQTIPVIHLLKLADYYMCCSRKQMTCAMYIFTIKGKTVSIFPSIESKLLVSRVILEDYQALSKDRSSKQKRTGC